LLWTDYYLHKENEDSFDRLADILGTRWTRDQVNQIFNGEIKRETSDVLSVPLSFIIQPEFQEALKGMFGSKHGIDAPEWVKKVEVVEGWDIPRDQFTQLARGASVVIPVEQFRKQTGNRPK
jgi:hypothetical protein